MESTLKGDFDFYNELGEKYPESKVVYDTPSGKLRLKHIGGMLSSLKGSLLDVGCNNYVYEPYWNGKGDYIGVDVAKALLLQGNRNGIRSHCYYLPFKDMSFDVVLCTEVIEHLWQRDKALGEMRRVLKTGGLMIISAPYRPKRNPSTLIWSPILEKYSIKKRSYLHGSLTLPQMATLAKQANLTILDTKYISSPGDDHIVFMLRRL